MIRLSRELHRRVLSWGDTNYVLGLGEALVRNHVLHGFIAAEGGYDPLDSEKDYDFTAGNVAAYINVQNIVNGASQRLFEVLGVDQTDKTTKGNLANGEPIVAIEQPQIEAAKSPVKGVAQTNGQVHDIEDFLQRVGSALEEDQYRLIKAVQLRLEGKTNAQVFKELGGDEAKFKEDHKGRGSKLVVSGLELLQRHGIEVTIPKPPGATPQAK